MKKGKKVTFFGNVINEEKCLECSKYQQRLE